MLVKSSRTFVLSSFQALSPGEAGGQRGAAARHQAGAAAEDAGAEHGQTAAAAAAAGHTGTGYHQHSL